MNQTYQPISFSRGDIYRVDFGRTRGSVEGGVRPALIVQNNMGNQHGPTLIVVPLTTRLKRCHLPVHVLLRKEDGLPETSLALCEQITTIDKSQASAFLAHLSCRSMERVTEGLEVSIGLDNSLRTTERSDEMLLTLCKHHLQPFFDDPCYRVRRMDSTQEKEPCVMCNAPGYDYMIRNVKKAHAPRPG